MPSSSPQFYFSPLPRWTLLWYFFSSFCQKSRKKVGKAFFCLPERLPWRSRREKSKKPCCHLEVLFLGNRVCLKRPTAFNLFMKKEVKLLLAVSPEKGLTFYRPSVTGGKGEKRERKREKMHFSSSHQICTTAGVDTKSVIWPGILPVQAFFFESAIAQSVAECNFAARHTHCIGACQKRETRIRSISRQSKMKR